MRVRNFIGCILLAPETRCPIYACIYMCVYICLCVYISHIYTFHVYIIEDIHA